MRGYDCAIDEREYLPAVCCRAVECLPVSETIRAARCGCGCGVTEVFGQRIYTDPTGAPYWWDLTGGEA